MTSIAVLAAEKLRKWLSGFVAVIVLAVVVRLATLGAYPLMDPTEARYAEMARKMAQLKANPEK